METRAHHVLIGLFTLIVVGGLMWFGLWLARGGLEREADYYDLVFEEEVTGLIVGSSVLYNGIRVGEVVELAIDPADPRRTMGRIRVARDTPVSEDTVAQLGVAGFLTGSAHVRLSGGSPESRPLPGGEGDVPVITVEPSPFSRLLAESDVFIERINTIVERVNQLLSPENTERFSRTLDHIEQTTGVVAEQQNQIRQGAQALLQAGHQADETLKEAAITLQEAAETVRQASRFLEHGNHLLDTHGDDIFENASRSMASLERTMTRIDSLTAGNQDAMDDAMQGMTEIGPALQELRMTLNTLRTVTRRLEEDPAGFLMSRDTIKEFKP